MVKFLLGILFLFSSYFIQAQNRSLPLHEYYKKETLKHSRPQLHPTFFPLNESQVALYDSIRDTAKIYVDFHQWLFKQDWIEVKRPDYNLYISPLVHGSYGNSFSGQDSLFLFENTRGIIASGNLGKEISFQFLFAENQSRYNTFLSTHFRSQGELYDFGNSYHRTNAVIPGAGRTKIFKGSAFDYAYSMGHISFQVNPSLRIEGGNGQHFIGAGYRSLLLSDYSVAAPYIRILKNMGQKWSYQLLFRRQKNLIRKIATKAIEPSYEHKAFSAFFLNYQARPNLNLALFSGGNFLRADSTVKHALPWNYFVPVPGMNTDLFLKGDLFHGIMGLQGEWRGRSALFYGQLAMEQESNFRLAAQGGFHIFDLLKVPNLHFQLEYNYVPQDMYAHQNFKLAYGHYNASSSHPKGNDFQEFILAADYQYKRFYGQLRNILYFGKSGNLNEQISQHSIFIHSDQKPDNPSNGSAWLVDTELGYRINRNYNPNIYLRLRSRLDSHSSDQSYFLFQFGVKVSVLNHYSDF
ncbi:MAG: hypothetical protein EP338_12855 [Bacteroidetes bacterium]|nr:MAG: hypothetical protein EP338_12855 [Bacteroidota bacterium]